LINSFTDLSPRVVTLRRQAPARLCKREQTRKGGHPTLNT
jgi:hypothetical protein